MRVRKTALVVVLLFALPLLHAQEQKSTDLAQAFEPAWQTDKARLFLVKLAPSQATESLTHERAWLLVTLTPGDVTFAPERARTRRIQFEPGHIEIATAASPTVIRNSGSTEAQFYLLELAGGIRAEAAACGLGGHDCESEYGDMSGPTYARSPHFDTPTVRAIETTVDPEAVLDPHEHPFPFVMIALSDLQLEGGTEGKPIDHISLKSGEFRAYEGGFTHILKNTGKTPARFLTLEVK